MPLSAVCDRLATRAGSVTAVDLQAWQETVGSACAESRRAELPLSDTEPTPPAAAAEPTAADPPAGRSYVRHVVTLVQQAAEAAHALHEAGVIHRDIKPGNILVTPDGARAVLMDLGLAQLADDVEGRLTRTRQFVGTLRYASPQQVLAVGALDRRTDVYSLGATLWELLTLRPLYGATEQTPTPELMERIQREEPGRLRAYHPGVGRDLEAVVHRCLEKDPARRYPAAAELARELGRYLAGEPVKARPVGSLARAWKWVKRRPAVAILLTAVALATAAGACGVAVAYRETLNRGEAEEAIRRAQEAQLQVEQDNRRRVQALVEQLVTADARAVPELLKNLEPQRALALPYLHVRWRASDGPQRLRCALALLPDDSSLCNELVSGMLGADDPHEMLLLLSGLRPFAAELKGGLWKRVDDDSTPPDVRFRALVALATFDPTSPRWKDAGRLAVEQLLKARSLYLGDWSKALRPASSALVGQLGDVYRDKVQADKRLVAAEILADYVRDDPAALVELTADSDPEQFARLAPLLQSHREKASELFAQELLRRAPDSAPEVERIALARRQAAAAAALMWLGRFEAALPVLRHTPTPDARSYLVRDLARRGVGAADVLKRLDEEKDASARRALILALGEYTAEQLPVGQRSALVPKLLDWYRNDPDAGVHGAIDWLLRHRTEGAVPRKIDWMGAGELARIDQNLAGKRPREDQNWYVSESGKTYSLVKGPADSPGAGEGRAVGESAKSKPAAWRIAVATRPVTFAELGEFLRSNPPGVPGQAKVAGAPTPRTPGSSGPRTPSSRGGRSSGGGSRSPPVPSRLDGSQPVSEQPQPAQLGSSFPAGERPGNNLLARAMDPVDDIDWYTAAKYCRWLSEKEGIREEEMCYPPMAEIKEGMQMPGDYLRRTGYRIPTEAEWEEACRAGSVTEWSFGDSEELLGRYCWYEVNSNRRSWPAGVKRPNDLGLFDMHGNVWQWCEDVYDSPPPGGVGTKDPGPQSTNRAYRPKGTVRILRGGSCDVPSPKTRSVYCDHEWSVNASPDRVKFVGLRIARSCR